MAINETIIEQFVLGTLHGNELHNFESALNNNAALAKEVRFQKELNAAVLETDIMDLRDQLKAISSDSDTNQDNDYQILFDLSQRIDHSKIGKNGHSDMSTNGNALQFIHVENHIKMLSERLHILGSENHHFAYLNNHTLNDHELWNEIAYSVKEEDVRELRSSLHEIISKREPAYSDFEIDQYINGELDKNIAAEMEQAIKSDPLMAAQVNLHHEIEEAIRETELHQLRSNIQEIINEAQSINLEETKRIDDYLMHYLTAEEEEYFEERIVEEPLLKKEIKLNSEINSAILEEDITQLRASLKQLTDAEKPDNKQRIFVPWNIRSTPVKLIGAAASLAAIITSGALLLNQQNKNNAALYHKYYQPYEMTGLYRSSAILNDEMAGVEMYNDKNYTGALERFQLVLSENPDHPMVNFYTGLSYQELEEFRSAITHFQMVIDEKDNLFIEQAEWYMALCYLKTDNQARAFSIFNEILHKNGYYSNDARKILKKTD